MMRRSWLLLLTILPVSPAMAQTVMRPDPPLDSVRAGLRDALLVLRDSLTTIDAAAARLQRDYRQASGPALLSRARVMREACASSIRTVPPTRRAVLDTPIREPHRLKQRSELLREMDRLKKALAQCEGEFTAMSRPGEAETVRGYANARAARIQSALRKYDGVLRGFLGAMGIKVTPPGATPHPAVG